MGIRLYTDEMIHPGPAAALRQLGCDAESCGEAGRSGQALRDADQLAYATQHGRAILTFNACDFLPLDAAWKAGGRVHGGIITSGQIEDFGEPLRRVRHHLDAYPPSVQHDTVLWLSAVPDP